jgi:hypothetical protein
VADVHPPVSTLTKKGAGSAVAEPTPGTAEAVLGSNREKSVCLRLGARPCAIAQLLLDCGGEFLFGDFQFELAFGIQLVGALDRHAAAFDII